MAIELVARSSHTRGGSTNLQLGTLTSFDLLSDELNTTTRLGQPGYLHQLSVSWGYDPSFYFAIDSFSVGAPALARFVNAAGAEPPRRHPGRCVQSLSRLVHS